MQRELKPVIREGQSISDVVGLVAPFLGWGRMRVGGRGHAMGLCPVFFKLNKFDGMCDDSVQRLCLGHSGS